MPVVYCLGSLNLDFVYQVESIVRPGETIKSLESATHFGGKGANQSIALARAGAEVRHIGMVGPDGDDLRTNLKNSGVDTSSVQQGTTRTGHAIIQVQKSGENSIIVEAGANASITEQLIESALETAQPNDWFLTQNETNMVESAVSFARRRGLTVAYNPSPFNAQTAAAVLGQVDLLILNESEGFQLTGQREPKKILEVIRERAGSVEVLLTLGECGAFFKAGEEEFFQPAVKVRAVDTTGAGDTFLGYFIGSRVTGATPAEALALAARAAAVCVTRAGAAASIPYLMELQSGNAS